MNVNRDIIAFVALAVGWGSSFAAIEVGLESLPPIFFAALRFDVAAAVFTVAVVVFGYRWRPQTGTDWTLIAIGGVLLIGAHFALLFLGQSYVSSAVAAIVLSLLPIVTPPLALLLLPHQRIRLTAVVGLFLGLAGVVLIALDGGALDGQAIGVGLLVLAAVTFALGSVLTERLRGTLPLVSLQAWSMAVGALVLHALSALHPAESLAAVEVTPAAIGALAYLSIVATAGGFFVYFTLLERVGATEVSLVNYAVPIVAALVGWAFLGEALTLATVAGFALILLGFTLCKIEALWTVLAPVVRRGRGGRSPSDSVEHSHATTDGGHAHSRHSSRDGDCRYPPCDD